MYYYYRIFAGFRPRFEVVVHHIPRIPEQRHVIEQNQLVAERVRWNRVPKIETSFRQYHQMVG